ncbi:MAG TPA: hypothetical protein VFZ79_20535 [Acidimicrobiales bacterium]
MTAAPTSITVGRLVARTLRAAGVDAVYGRPLAGVRVVRVEADGLAMLMAAAHARVHGRPAAVHRGDGTLAVGADPDAGGAPGAATPVDSVEDLLSSVQAVHAAAHGRSGRLAMALALDPDAPAPDVVPTPPVPPDRWTPPDDALVAAVRAAARPVVLAGPGVVWAGAVPGLHAVAAAAGLGVLNTWGAKGVFDWRSPHHLATAGLQARDFELGGLAEADLIVATGIDPAEAPGQRWRHLAPVVDVASGALDPLAGRWSRPPVAIAVPPLRAALGRVTQEGWASSATPLAPSLVTRHYAAVVGPGGLVAADPGVAGYWVARTFATTGVGSVHVPASPGSRGFAVACAAVARLRAPDRPVLAVVDGPADDHVREALDCARRLGADVPVEQWSAGGEPLDAAHHLDRLRRLVLGGTAGVADLATDAGQLDRMVEVAGDVIAWTA